MRTRGRVSASGIPYTVAVKVTMPEDATFEPGRIKGATGRLSLEAVDSEGRPISNMRAWMVYIDEKLTATSIQLGAADGPWKTRARDSSRGGKSTAGIVFSKAYESDGGVRIIVADEHLDLDYRIAAIDTQGKEHLFQQRGGSAGKVRQTTALFHDIKLNQIEYFLFQTRPYQWVTFKNVSLRPGQKTDVHVEVEPVVGEWEDVGKAVPADFNDTISLAEHITVASIGQNAEGKTFIALLRDREKTRNQQYRFILIRRSGTVVEPSSLKTNTFADKLREKFSFDMPYHHNQIKEFRLQRFPQNLARKASLPVIKPYDPGVNGKIAAQATSGPPGRGALHFDGQNDYLYVPDSWSLWMKAPFTVEMWIKPEFPKEQFEHRTSWGLIGKGCIGKDWILGMGKVEMRGFGITLHRFGDDPNLLMVDYCAANLGRVYTKPYGRSDFDDWMHLYHVFHPDRYTPGHTHPLVIGRFLTSEHLFAGKIGEIRIWVGARSRDQISEYRNKPLTGDEPDLVACWTFEQSGGQIAYDISNHRNHARLGTTTDADDADPTWVTVTGGSTPVKEPGNETDDQVIARSTIEPIGKHALSFDGVDDYLHVAANSTLMLKSPFTIEMWLKPDFSDIPRTKDSEKLWPFLSLLRKGKRLFQEEKIQAGGFMMFVGPSSQQDRKCYGNLYLGSEDGLLYQVGRFGGERLQPTRPSWLYVSMSCTKETYIPVPEQPLMIGQNIVPSGFPFKGDIAEIRIWSDVRSGYQVARYRNKPLNGNEPGLVACWDFKRPGGQVVYDIGPNGNHARLGGSEGPDNADPKWVDLQAPSPQPNLKTDAQVESIKRKAEISGFVEDENGSPIAGASVTLLNKELFLLPKPEKLGEMVHLVISDHFHNITDTNGRFEFVDLNPGKTDISVKSQGYRTEILREITTGTKNLRITLGKPSAYTLAGDVVDGKGNPISGVEITLAGESSTTVPTDEKGVFRFEDQLKPTTVRRALALFARKKGFGVWGKTLDTTGGQTYVKIILLPEEKISGRVVDQIGKPIANATILFWSSVGRDTTFSFTGKWQEIALRTGTDANGQFTLTGIPTESDISLRALAPGYASSEIYSVKTGEFGSYAVRNKDRGTTMVHGSNREPAETIEFKLQKAVTLCGTLTYDDSGRPAPGLKIMTQSHKRSQWAKTRTDLTGRFELEGVSPNPCNLLVFQENSGKDSLPKWTAAAIEFDDLQEGETRSDIRLVLTKGGIIRGKAVDAEGNPLYGIDIAFYSAARPRSGGSCQATNTAKDGSWAYRFPPGEVYVYIRTTIPEGNWSRKSYTLLLDDGQEIDDIDFELSRVVSENSPYR
ncbi:MAG: carboxypeptidase regulatory-like domain-containing protein [Desulfobacterales bacterium]|nr:carboxypeptidase regulatory-like domain-containing protein [Desulfobacterales bacterium]